MPRRIPPAAIAALALALSACTTARTQAPAKASSTPAAQGATAEAPPPPLVCRTERPTGSNIPRRVCYSQEALDDVSRAAQDAHRRAIGSQSQPRRD